MEALQGRPDHFVARMIRKVSQLVRNGSFTDFSNDPLLKSTQDWLWIINRRMIKGKALSTAFATMFGQVEARSLVDGRIIAVDEYLRTFDPGKFRAHPQEGFVASGARY